MGFVFPVLSAIGCFVLGVSFSGMLDRDKTWHKLKPKNAVYHCPKYWNLFVSQSVTIAELQTGRQVQAGTQKRKPVPEK